LNIKPNMNTNLSLSPGNIVRDLTAGLVVFLVALPLCLGVALASRAQGLAEAANVPLFAGILAGIIGGLIVGVISGSHTSVSGPAAGLTAVVAAQIAELGTFDAFLLAVLLAGLLQIVLGIFRAGFIAAFFPSSVIKGLLAAIGVILILKQIPHVLGHDADPMGDKSFFQPDKENTFSELVRTWFDIQPGATVVGLISVFLMIAWDRFKLLKRTPVPAPLVVVLMGVAISIALRSVGGDWAIESSHLVQVPVSGNVSEFLGFLRFPDFGAWNNPAIYVSAATIAIVASLETLLNIEAVDKLDPEQRSTPTSRELLAQGAGNVVAGLIGGLPVTSVIVRSSVNINSGVKTKLSTIWHGLLLLGSVMLVPGWLNEIPLAALAGILLVTGLKLASPELFRRMWSEGRNQFLPFAGTVIAIVLTDLLTGILIGLAIAIGFILYSNFRRPMLKIMEKHATGEVLRVELANQVSFLNRAALERTLREVPKGGHVLLDARNTDYIDPDVLDLIADFKDTISTAHGVHLSLVGFREKYPRLEDHIQFIDYSTREVQNALTPARVIEFLKEGNERFRTGNRLVRDLGRQVNATSAGQFPMAVVLSCIDSRTPAELVFDLGLGDIFSVRIAGNVARSKVFGSLEYGCAVAGARLILVMGHTSCGAVNTAVELFGARKSIAEATGCSNLDLLISVIQESVDPATVKKPEEWLPGEKAAYADGVSRRNVLRTMRTIIASSPTLAGMVREGKLAIVGALYDIANGEVSFFQTAESSREKLPIATVVQ
jgi:carbonic anhydrase/SulP family sulfate permease